ncbi:MAG: hypothetical protein VKJ46_11020 [Leptolyngbyaceae bacterium]|nr:hypothetical protein [Leptolyngbyaceae bacterium]
MLGNLALVQPPVLLTVLDAQAETVQADLLFSLRVFGCNPEAQMKFQKFMNQNPGSNPAKTWRSLD